MVRQPATKPKVLQKRRCGSCGEIFNGKMCPNCGEEIDVTPINIDGVSTDDVASAIGATHGLPIHLMKSPEFDPDAVIDQAMQSQLKSSIQEANLDKVKTLAAEQAAKRMRAEKELEDTKSGFTKPVQEQQEEPNGFASMSPGIFLQALGGWDPDQREHFLNQLSSDPMLALNLSMMMNPGKSGGMNPMGMMNPMAMMGGMMQPQVEQAPPADAADMVTAMIAGMQALQEMGGGNKGNDKQMDRLLDKMDEMRRDTESLKMQLVEAQNHKSELNTEDIRHIVADAMTGATKGKMGLLNGLAEIHAVRDELIGLGIAQVPSSGVDPTHTLEMRKFDHQVRMDEKRDTQSHELELKSVDIEVAKANAQSGFMSSLVEAAKRKKEDKVEEEEDKQPEPQVRVESQPASVIS